VGLHDVIHKGRGHNGKSGGTQKIFLQFVNTALKLVRAVTTNYQLTVAVQIMVCPAPYTDSLYSSGPITGLYRVYLHISLPYHVLVYGHSVTPIGNLWPALHGVYSDHENLLRVSRCVSPLRTLRPFRMDSTESGKTMYSVMIAHLLHIFHMHLSLFTSPVHLPVISLVYDPAIYLCIAFSFRGRCPTNTHQ
jgi:hypothetical protein